MYALIGIVDETIDSAVRQVWAGLKERNLSNYAYETKGLRPHLTLASFEEVELADLLPVLEDLAADLSRVSLTCSAIGSFLGVPIIALHPVKTPDLLNFHEKIQQSLRNFLSEDSLYAPARWVPHFTLANRVDREKFAEAYSYCLEN